MHEILQNIRTKNDTVAAINNCIHEGKINTTEAEKVREMLEKFWQLPKTIDWFSETNTVLNEAVILTPGAKLYRPDRVVINGRKATVIDYKFGEAEKDSYVKQVKNYMQLISEMGYDVSGYLSYITLGKNIDVIM
jgi:predicted RecB family nuclease